MLALLWDHHPATFIGLEPLVFELLLHCPWPTFQSTSVLGPLFEDLLPDETLVGHMDHMDHMESVMQGSGFGVVQGTGVSGLGSTR